MPPWVNSSRPRDSYMRQWTCSSLDQMMAWCLSGAKPLADPILTYHQFESKKQISMKFSLKLKSEERDLEMSSAKWQPFGFLIKVFTILSLGRASHYGDVIMGAIATHITSPTVVYSSDYSDADQRKHQGSASLAFVRGIHRGPVNSPHKWSVTRKMFPFDDVIMRMWNFIYLFCCEKTCSGLDLLRWHSFIINQWQWQNHQHRDQWKPCQQCVLEARGDIRSVRVEGQFVGL